MPAPANLVHQTATVTGTGDVTLTKVNGKQDFATAFTTVGTNVFDYFISNRDAAEWERGTGSAPTTNTLRRDTVIETHAGTTEKVSFSAGTKDVTNDVPALTQVRGTTVATSGFVPTFTTTGGNELQASGVIATTAAIHPATNDGVTLGTSALKFADLHLAAGGVLQFSTEATNITHAASQLTIAASSININTSQLTVSAVTANIGSVRFTTAVVQPITNDGVALGSSALKFSDLFLASGAVLQFSTEATNITHSASVLTIAASTIVTNSVAQSTAAIYPVTSEGVTLGTSTNRWAGVFTSSGVNFPAAVDASADVNTLDDYEEGTFTPTWTPATTGTFTIGYDAFTTGTYTKIGDRVLAEGNVTVTTLSSGTGTGQMGISGLPFNCRAAGTAMFTCRMSSAYRGCRLAIMTTGTNVARAFLGPIASTGVTSALALADITTNAQTVYFNGQYGA